MANLRIIILPPHKVRLVSSAGSIQAWGRGGKARTSTVSPSRLVPERIGAADWDHTLKTWSRLSVGNAGTSGHVFSAGGSWAGISCWLVRSFAISLWFKMAGPDSRGVLLMKSAWRILKERIEKYQPRTLWLDGEKMADTADQLRSRELAATYYNLSNNPEEVAIEDALGSHKSATWGKSLAHGDWHDGKPRAKTATGIDVRFTTRDDSRFAILFDWPDTEFTIANLCAQPNSAATGSPLRWTAQLVMIIPSTDLPPRLARTSCSAQRWTSDRCQADCRSS